MERTPGKWGYKVHESEVEILDENGTCVAFTHWTHDPRALHGAEANAACIVRAVNCHERLVEVVRDLRDKPWGLRLMPTLTESACEAMIRDTWLPRIDAALALAEGRE